MEFLDLNDDCLIHICYFLDAESIVTATQTCTRLKDIAERYVKLKKSYTCYIGCPKSEAIAAKTLRKVGKYLNKIDLMVDLEYRRSLKKMFQLIVEKVGQNVTELSILGETCSMPLHILAPILSHLEVLTLQNLCWEENCVSKIDLPSLCPNLRKLIVCGQIIFAPYQQKSFRRLVSLDVTFSPEQIPEEVFTHNRQLTMLNLRNRRTANSVSLTSFNGMLINLVKLHLDVQLIENPIQHLPSLSNFQLLHSLELYSIPAASFGDILKILETLDRLEDIVLQCHLTRSDSQFSSIQESFPIMAGKLIRLRSFITVSIDWTQESVVDFVGRAQQLIYLDFWSGSDTNYKITPDFIRSLADIRNLLVNAGMQPLRLKLYRMDDGLRRVLQEPLVASMIQLAR